MLGERLLESNLIPDVVIRAKIRRLLKLRLQLEKHSDLEAFASRLRRDPIAVQTKEANDQHYEVPAKFFQLVLGPHLKYSCALFDDGTTDLAIAESRMLALTAERAGLADGQRILELGCGWGSLSLWMAKHYPNSQITSVSNSSSQKAFIDACAKDRGLANLSVVTADMNDFSTDSRFDRIVSVEMFEHMRNIPALFEKVASFLKPEGRLFVHIFSHVQHAYLFENRDQTDWMAKYFFSGGMMPSDALYGRMNQHLTIENQWVVTGTHYQKTAEAWLANMDAARKDILPVLASTYGAQNTNKWWVYWRVFFMSCAELWGYRGGNEWHVMHYLFRRQDQS